MTIYISLSICVALLIAFLFISLAHSKVMPHPMLAALHDKDSYLTHPRYDPESAVLIQLDLLCVVKLVHYCSLRVVLGGAGPGQGVALLRYPIFLSRTFFVKATSLSAKFL